MTMTGKVNYDLYSQEFSRHAYEIFERMRKDNPVIQQPGMDGETPIWFLSRYQDVEAMLKDDQHFVLDYRMVYDQEELTTLRRTQPELMDMLNNHLLTKEGEDHRRLRSLVTLAFTPLRINAMRPRIQEIAEGLLDKVDAQGEMDLVESYAFPLPIIVIAELLGIPAEDRDKFRTWSDIFVNPPVTPELQSQYMQMGIAFVGYLKTLFDERRKAPKDDLLSALLQAEEGTERLSMQELFSMVILLIVAGHETTVTLIGNATVAMLTHPEVMQRLKQHPEEMPKAVEELLRFDSPVDRTVTRFVASDVELDGHALKRGDLVIGLLGSANRDDAQFEDAGSVNIDRDNRSHVGFGKGVHYCLGAPLARLEGEIALNTLLRRLPGLKLAVPLETLEYRQVPLFHAYTHIPVAF